MTFPSNELPPSTLPTGMSVRSCRPLSSDTWQLKSGEAVEDPPLILQKMWSTPRKPWENMEKMRLNSLNSGFFIDFKGISYGKVWKHQRFISQHFRNAIFRQPLKKCDGQWGY